MCCVCGCQLAITASVGCYPLGRRRAALTESQPTEPGRSNWLKHLGRLCCGPLLPAPSTAAPATSPAEKPSGTAGLLPIPAHPSAPGVAAPQQLPGASGSQAADPSGRAQQELQPKPRKQSARARGGRRGRGKGAVRSTDPTDNGSTPSSDTAQDNANSAAALHAARSHVPDFAARSPAQH